MKPIYAAPLQGFTETAWRNAHEQVFGGVAAYYTPFVRLEKEEVRNKDKRELLPARNKVRHLVPQVVAAGPEEFNKLVEFLYRQGYREIDLNMGCPFPLIAHKGKGAGILPYPERVAALLGAMNAWKDVRFTVKMRLGWEDPDEWKQILPLLNVSCVKQITLHPRIGKQQYKGETNMTAFREFCTLCELPLVYNGDLLTLADICRVEAEFPQLAGVMLGRGLLANPSLASVVQLGRDMDEQELYAKVWDMHQYMYEAYAATIEGGEAQLVQKMKSQWEYLLPDLDRKARKQIMKSRTLEMYLQAVSQALRGF